MAWVVFVSTIPIVLWAYAYWPIGRLFTDPYSIFLSLGQITGIVGLALFSINLILSARLRFLEDLFRGLNQIYKRHHQIGGVAFILLMFHPLLILFSRASLSIEYAVGLITPGNDFFVDLGIISLLLLMTLLIVTFYRKLPYQIWRLTHKFTGLVFMIAVFHSFFVPSTISENTPLFIYMLMLVAIGIVSYLYRTVFFRLFVKRYEYKVIKTVKLTDKIIKIVLAPNEAKKIDYYPGQFVFISFKADNITDEIHPFSIASVDTNEIVIISKNEGDYTKALLSLTKDSKALIEGPFGRFSTHYYDNPRQIWIAGGIGITPFIGMTETIKKANLDVDLYYCIKEENEKIDVPRKDLKLDIYLSKIQGHITADYIKEKSKDFEKAEFFICGPDSMMTHLRNQLVKLGIRNSRIHTEEFNFD